VGLAAGFDKNAEAVAPLARAGFGFLEVGAATPRAQPGNPKPRLFRLSADRAVINRFGFNNDGMEAIATRLGAAYPAAVPIGLNLGANKDGTDRAADFATVLARCGAFVDFATVNVSSPNTERLRELQGRAALQGLLDGVMATRADLARPIAARDLFPDIDQINSTLRDSGDRSAGDADASDIDTLETIPRKRRGVRIGFFLAVALGAGAVALYANADVVTAQVPALASVTDGYVAAVNGLRFWLDDLAQGLGNSAQ
jgi:dihydroorotate dehydrogenase